MLGVARGASDAEIKRAFRKLAQQWHPDVNQDPEAPGALQGDQRRLPGPERPGAARALRHVRAGRRGRRRAPAAPGSRASAASPTSSMRSSVARPVAATPRRGRPQPGADLRYDLRITFEEAVKGTEKEIEFRVLQRCETCSRQRRQARHRARSPAPSARAAARSAACARRCSARWSTSAPARAAGARARSSRRPATRARATAGPERKRTLRVTIPAGIDEGHQIRLTNEGEVGPRGGPPGSLYVAVHVAPARRRLKRDGHRAVLRGRRSRIAQAALGTRITVPDRRWRRGGRDQGRHPARHRDPAARQGRARTCAAARAATCTCSSMWPCRPSSPRSSASCSRPTPRSPARRSGGGGPAREARPVVAGAGGAWLELAVEADLEAVEAVSEILGRVASGGTTVEPAFDLVEEGLGARVDPTRPATVRGYVPARDAAAAEAAAAEVAEALGHLQAFGLRTIGDLRTRIVHEEDWADAWKAYFPVLRVGRRLVIRPTWRRHRRQPDDVVLAHGPGHGLRDRAAPDDAAVPGRARAAGRRGGAGRRARPRRRLRLGHPGHRRRCASAPTAALGVDTDPIAIEATAGQRPAQRPRPGASGPASAACRQRRAAVRRRPGQPHRRRPGAARAAAPSDELRPGGTLLASGIFIDREAEVRAAFEAAGLVVGERDRGRGVGRARGRAGLTRAVDRAPRPSRRTIGRDARQPLPGPAGGPHHPGHQPVPAVDPAAVHAAHPAGDGRVGEPGRARRCCGPSRTARSSSGPAWP